MSDKNKNSEANFTSITGFSLDEFKNITSTVN